MDEFEDDDDTFTCGHCKRVFSRYDVFVAHKRSKECKTPSASVAVEAMPVLEPQTPKSKRLCFEEERDAEEAAVISLLANQLSSHKPGQKNASKAASKSKKAVRTTVDDSDVRDDSFDTSFSYLESVAEISPLVSGASFESIPSRQEPVKPKPKKKAKAMKSVQTLVISTTATETTSTASKAHMMVAMPLAPSKGAYSCLVVGCSYSASYAKDLSRHMRTHTGRFPVQCTYVYCVVSKQIQLSYSWTRGLERFLFNLFFADVGERPFSCSICEKSFSRLDKLRMHERIHAGIKPYKCGMCDYVSNDSGAVRKHLRVHTNERPYK
jgi:uncharacterized Zn-finger protein